MPVRPFRVTTPSPAPIGRLPNGHFARGDLPPSAPEIARRSLSEGVDARSISAGGPAEHAPSIPWPELGPTYNEARRSPFRIVG